MTSVVGKVITYRRMRQITIFRIMGTRFPRVREGFTKMETEIRIRGI